MTLEDLIEVLEKLKKRHKNNKVINCKGESISEIDIVEKSMGNGKSTKVVLIN